MNGEKLSVPLVLANFEFHGERFQVWDNEGRLWLVHERRWEEYPSWELLFQL